MRLETEVPCDGAIHQDVKEPGGALSQFRPVPLHYPW